jgi:predicted metal-dependent hydrolase
VDELRYISSYPEQVKAQVQQLIRQNQLADYLLQKYPQVHDIKSSKALYSYVLALKNQFMRKSNPLSKVIYDDKLDVLHQALGLHSLVVRVQGAKLKAKNEIRVGTIFKNAPIEFLCMISVHELAHLKEKQHNKAFYKLCEYMEPNYQQLEFDMRLYMIYLESFGELYSNKLFKVKK